MEIRYTLTLGEFREGYLIMLRSSTWRYRLFAWQFTWLGPLLGVFLVAMAILTFLLGGDQKIWAILVFSIALLALSAPLRLRSSIKRQFRLQKLEDGIVLAVSAQDVTLSRQNRDAETRYGWSALERADESKTLFLLFPHRLAFIPVPKRALTPEQEQEMRSLVATHIPGASLKPSAVS